MQKRFSALRHWLPTYKPIALQRRQCFSARSLLLGKWEITSYNGPGRVFPSVGNAFDKALGGVNLPLSNRKLKRLRYLARARKEEEKRRQKPSEDKNEAHVNFKTIGPRISKPVDALHRDLELTLNSTIGLLGAQALQTVEAVLRDISQRKVFADNSNGNPNSIKERLDDATRAVARNTCRVQECSVIVLEIAALNNSVPDDGQVKKTKINTAGNTISSIYGPYLEQPPRIWALVSPVLSKELKTWIGNGSPAIESIENGRVNDLWEWYP
ncbi:hypothetical protein BX600DRAFT_429672 [Xylariales sp. PMI_506]|nr:hypothetical protein BX600DRAFT_429672 [Xylariales sp. PMI_506]